MVSVVIPCYNAGDTIVDCVQSAVEQSYKDMEIIIVDDGSTDRSMTILKDYLEKERLQEKVIIVSQKNQGPSASRNKGIDLAKGEFIAFLDSDDYWNSEKLEIQIRLLKEDKEAQLIGCVYNDNFNKGKEMLTQVRFTDFLKKNYFPTPTVVAKREVLQELRFNEQQKYSEDYRLWLQISKKYKCLLVNESLTHSISQKLEYGHSGLSANLWEMEKGELLNFLFIYHKGYINSAQMLYYSLLSLLKYLRRRIIIVFHRKKSGFIQKLL